MPVVGRTFQLRGLQSERPIRPLLVVVLHELGQHGPKMLLVHDDDVVKALAAESPDHSLRNGVHVCRQLPAVAAIRSDSM
jgi:hypothetical protein